MYVKRNPLARGDSPSSEADQCDINVLWFVLLIAGFLVGFILQYAKLQRSQKELSASTKQLGSCQSSEQLSQLRDKATMMYLEAVQKNYGVAGE